MAAPNGDSNGNSSPSMLHVEAIQTAIPARPTVAGRSRRVSAAPLGSAALQSHLRLVLYYKRASEEETAWTVAAWIKDSLAEALLAEPSLAGRLRRDLEEEGWWELKYNDAGVRLVQATAETTLAEFLGSKERDRKEAALAHWVDINRNAPHFSALFYVQVTDFEDDGYAIGISSSLLLASPLFVIKFLKSWARTHNQMLAQGQLTKSPIFHLSYFKRPGRPSHLSSTTLDSVPSSASTTNLFKVPLASGEPGAAPPPIEKLASMCLDEAAQRLQVKAVSTFNLIVADSQEELKIETCTKDDSAKSGGYEGALGVARWDEFGAETVSFGVGNKPMHVSYCIVSGGDEGLVVAMPHADDEGTSELLISATVPKKI